MALLVSVITACASSLERPVRDITIDLNSFEYSKVDSDSVEFMVNGHLRNPNELSIRPLHFTYQISLDGRHFTKGQINVRGIDEQLGLGIDLQEARLYIYGQNAKLYYKSNTPFSFPVSIPFDQLGGIGAAMERNRLPYSINLVFTDERGKRAVLQHQGIINLTVILKPVVFRNVEIQQTANGSEITVGLFNDNDFDLEVESCSYQLTGLNVNESDIMFEEKKNIKALSWELMRAETQNRLPKGTAYSFEAGCRTGDSWFSNSLEATVK